MEENRADELVNANSENTVAVNTKHQVIKYAAIWVALLAVFFILNMVVRSVMASGNAGESQNGYYASGQQVSNSVPNSIPGGAPSGSGVQSGRPAVGAGGNCCVNGGPAGAGGGCCGGTAQTTNGSNGVSASGSTDSKKLEQLAINWYVQNFGDANVTAEVKDFGCHQQINILKDGKVVKELQYRNGQLSLLQ